MAIKIKIAVDCVNCGEELVHSVLDLSDTGVVHISLFEQQTFTCEHCDHETVTGELEMIDSEDC